MGSSIRRVTIIYFQICVAEARVVPGLLCCIYSGKLHQRAETLRGDTEMSYVRLLACIK